MFYSIWLKIFIWYDFVNQLVVIKIFSIIDVRTLDLYLMVNAMNQ